MTKMDKIEKELEKEWQQMGWFEKLKVYLVVQLMIIGFTLTYIWWDIEDYFRGEK